MNASPLAAQLGSPHHTAYIVESLEETASRLTRQLGAGPFLYLENVPLEDVMSRGESAELGHDAAFGSCGGYPIELMQVKSASPDRVEERFKGGLPRVHHVAFVLPRGEAVEARGALEDAGLPQYLSSSLGEVDNSFHDGSGTLGHDVEIQVDAEAFRGFFAMILGAAEGWDGSDAFRPIEM